MFCNPPWGNIRPFILQAPEAELAVLLVPARVNIGWFHDARKLGARVRFFKGKPRFKGAPTTSPEGVLLLVWGA